ncbi:protein of unknown function [Cupriavidus taiwanensis]|nr:protein of unknown function [Cupriavidus taiwanensis]
MPLIGTEFVPNATWRNPGRLTAGRTSLDVTEARCGRSKPREGFPEVVHYAHQLGQHSAQQRAGFGGLTSGARAP